MVFVYFFFTKNGRETEREKIDTDENGKNVAKNRFFS